MVLKLYGTGQSTCTRRVATVLHEKKVPFELVEIDLLKGGQKAPEVVKNQPFGQIPYIDDDGFILYESRAICRYLATKYADQGTPLIPDGLKENALFEQAASIEQNNFEPYATKAVYEGAVKPMFLGLKADQATCDEQIAQLSAKLDAYEVILKKQKYLAGNAVTLADLFHLPYGDMLKLTGSKIMTDPSRPNVSKWWTDITNRPSWLAVKDGQLKPNV